MAALTGGICVAATALSCLLPEQLACLCISGDETMVLKAAKAFIVIQSWF